MKYIALLRGINVGGHKKMPMAVLREILAKNGLKNVQTYIQSGNVIFEYRDQDKYTIADIISKIIFDNFGFEVPVIVKTRVDLEHIIESCPFNQIEKEQSYFMMLNKVPQVDLVKELESLKYENEVFKIKGDCIYFFASNGYGRTKFNSNFFERKLKVISTARNYKTMIKLLSLSE